MLLTRLQRKSLVSSSLFGFLLVKGRRLPPESCTREAAPEASPGRLPLRKNDIRQIPESLFVVFEVVHPLEIFERHDHQRIGIVVDHKLKILPDRILLLNLRELRSEYLPEQEWQ